MNDISLNEFNFLDYLEFLKITWFLLVLIVSQYIEEFPIIEELEFFFQSQYCEITIIEDPLYNFVIYFPIHRKRVHSTLAN